MYAKCRSLEDAHKVFDEMPQRDFIIWTALISGYSQFGRSRDGLVLFNRMLRHEFCPNEFTLSSVVKVDAAL
ncbi:unnamed protein product [Cochlearia groenlandica]